jgi:ATP-dependent helicase/nuclease subunit B
MYLDGLPWSKQAASIGEVRTGPLGFLSILETRLGLSGLSVHPVHRIDEYMRRMQHIDSDTAWFHNSFADDPWSTARQMLAWRDELVEAGWRGDQNTVGSLRLQALTELENVDLPLTPGRPERLRAVIRQLEKGKKVGIASISLVEPLEVLPPVWRHLIGLLQEQGVRIGQLPQPTGCKHTSNLAAVQNTLLGNEGDDLLSREDDSLILLEADNEWQAAEHLALWLAAAPDANEQVTIICGSDTSILDQALRRHGLPCLGRAEISRWREIQQVLPLVLANVWKPVDIRLLVEMLSLTVTPFPWFVCRRLLKAIAEEPGVGGRAWQKALEDIEKGYQERLAEKKVPEAAEKARQYVQEIQGVLVEERFDPMEGIPEDVLRDRCQKVINLLGKRLSKKPMLAEIIGQAREIQKIALGKGKIPRITLERMLDTVIGAGSKNLDIYEEAAPWHVVDHPGQVIDPRREIIWWGFQDPMIHPHAYWSKQERMELQAAGVFIEESKCFRNREANAWLQAFANAQERFIAIHIARMDGEPISHHPFWDTIFQAVTQTGKGCAEGEAMQAVVRKCRELGNSANWAFAGRHCTLRKVEAESERGLISEYKVEEKHIKPKQELSYSQISAMIACPMKWALQYYAGLRLPTSQAIPSGNQMLGTLCHRIVEELYAARKQWEPDVAGDRARALYDQLLPSMASELLLEGRMVENRRYREAIARAISILVEAINRYGLTVEATEAALKGKIEDIEVTGYADLLLRDSGGQAFVLDMKWSASDKYKRQEVADGSALQLATYAWMLRSAEAAQEVHAGYFMLAQGQLISDSPLLGSRAVESAATLEQIWKMAFASLKEVLNDLDQGSLKANGIEELKMHRDSGESLDKIQAQRKEQYLAKGMLYQDPSCKYCAFSRLCGWAGGNR